MNSLPDFEDPALADKIRHLTTEQIDQLAFGALRLDGAGIVAFFSKAEARLSGYGDRQAVGLHFFTDIAPCMNNPDYRGRLDSGLASGTLNARFTWVGDFSNRARVIQVRLHGIEGGGCWIFMHRES
jgi:photoactive yellow protein